MMENRDEILKMDDDSLSKLCTLEFFKATGNGGQKRNKTSSAVRVRLTGAPYCASDCSERSQHRNRSIALRKLKLAVAYGERAAPLPPERPECALDHPDYPVWLARILDRLAAAGWELKAAAAELGSSTSALLKRIARDPELWQYVNAMRQKNNLPVLKK